MELGVPIELTYLTVEPRLRACRSGSSNNRLKSTTDELSLGARVVHVFDLQWLSLEAGGSLGYSLVHQQFVTTGLAPDRTGSAGYFGVAGGVTRELGLGFLVRADLEGRTYVFRYSDGATVELRAASTAVMSIGLGKRF